MGYCYHCGAELVGPFCAACGRSNTATDAEQQRAERAQGFELKVNLDDIPDAPPPVAQQPSQPPVVPPPMVPAGYIPYGTPLYAAPIPPQPEKESVSVGGWIGRYLITLIPIVGPIIYFIMLFVWSGDESMDDSARNWAKAQLILLLVVLGIVFVVVLLFFLFTMLMLA